MDDGPNLKNFLNNENPMMFLHLVNMMTMRNQFTDADTLQLLVELILVCSKPFLKENRIYEKLLQITSVFFFPSVGQ